jgi:histone H3/H4
MAAELLIPSTPFIRLVREIMGELRPERHGGLRIEAPALGALQGVVEAMLLIEFESSCCLPSIFVNFY